MIYMIIHFNDCDLIVGHSKVMSNTAIRGCIDGSTEHFKPNIRLIVIIQFCL